MQKVRDRMSMSVGVFAVVHAVAPQRNVGRQAPEGGTPTPKRRRTPNAGVRKGKNTVTAGNDMVDIDAVFDSRIIVYADANMTDTTNVVSVPGGIIQDQVMFVRDKDDDFRELDFGPEMRVRNWSLSRWCEKDNEEPDIPYNDLGWPESDAQE